MRERLKYFLFNKKLDYERGFLWNMDYDDSGFWVKKEEESSKGYFISRILDSKEQEMEWHRLSVSLNSEAGQAYRVMVYVTDEKKQGLDAFIKNPDIGIKDKLKEFEPYCQLTETGKHDILLHNVKGRYLWLVVEAFRQFDNPMVFQQIQIYFPKQTWLSYLPEVYQGNDQDGFLERYLSVFETIYEELNSKIRNIPYLLDVSSADIEDLDYLGEWFGISNSYMWPEERKRNYLKRALPLFRIRGTRRGIQETLKMYLEDDVYVVEKCQWSKKWFSKQKREEYQLLYGNNPYQVTILVKEESVENLDSYQALLLLTEAIKPVQAEIKLVVLKPYIFLGGHSYLGINSRLSGYSNASLNGKAAVSFAAIGN